MNTCRLLLTNYRGIAVASGSERGMGLGGSSSTKHCSWPTWMDGAPSDVANPAAV